MNLQKKINLRDTLSLLAMSWSQVTENSIKNWFNRGTFIKGCVIVEEGLEKISGQNERGVTRWPYVTAAAKLAEEDDGRHAEACEVDADAVKKFASGNRL